MPQQVLAQYASVNNKADQTANTPFQSYSGEFVAPTNATQNSGIAGTNAAANEAQPYFDAATGTLGGAQSNVNPINQAATGLAAGSAQAVNPSDLNGAAIDKYMSPYLKDVVGSESQLLNQNNQQQQAGQLGNAITSGAFGGDRTGIAAANLEQQQNLSNANIYSGLLNQGYNTALGTAQQQQGVGLAAGQANRAALGNAATTLAGVGQTAYGEGANTATTLAGLGTGAQSAALQGSQAQIAAGTVQQQTQQAQDTAEYNQFLQQQSYPFQVDQFLASIAEGTGALSGSTTTTQQPGGFFSDERLKEDMEPIGRTFDGQPIYRYKMKGDDRDRIGLSAQKVEKKHPEAVGVAGGFRYVDYGKATEAAANRGHFHEGGVVPFRRAFAGGGGPDDGGGLDAVLAAQRNMYASGVGGGQQQRNIQAPAASHQLAVASGSPTPAASGSSHVSQAVGLGKDAYKGYKWATKPSATGVNANPGNTAGAPAPSNTAAGTTTNFEAPSAGVDGSPGTTTTFDAGLQSADSAAAPAASEAAAPVAADAAGTGAADAGVAAGAGADAAAGAAAGIGGGAAAGAAADAAGTEAAALAAEYAAAYAAAAAAAAKRGGRITRGKFADGGTPYETNGDQLDIPVDEQTNAHLQSPGALVKRPTGMQIAMKGGQPDQASSTMGSIFSNEALARGGVAGRRGYDDGGAPTDDTVDDAPEVASDADRGAGVTGGSKDSLWEKVKKHATAENVIPILSGLAAMGTAKTRSPGVALAAGLGAGSQSYLDTRASLAQSANEQAKTRGVDIANRLNTVKAKYAEDWQNNQTPVPGAGASPAAPTSPSMTGSQPVSPEIEARNKYFVNPAMTAQEQANYQRALGAKSAGIEGPVQSAENAYKQRVLNQQAQNQSAAQAEHDAYYHVATDPETPAPVKTAAIAKVNALRQWTGDEYIDQGGALVNKRTGRPPIGDAAQRIGPAKRADLMNEANAPIDVPTSEPGVTKQVPRWQYRNFNNADEYVESIAPTPSAAGTAAPSGTPAASSRSTAPATSHVPAAQAPNADPVLTKALADPEYKVASAPVIRGQTPSDENRKQVAARVEAKTGLQKDAEDATRASATALQYSLAAKQIMDSKGKPVTGLFGPVAKEISRVWGGVDATNYQEVAKYLGNAAVQNGKANFPNATQSEVGLQLNELSPNLQQTDAAISDLIDSNIRSSKYTMDSAKRVGTYLNSSGDPQKFARWNQTYYPREDIVNATDKPATGGPPKGWTLHVDAKGRKAYVSPDGKQYQLVQ